MSDTRDVFAICDELTEAYAAHNPSKATEEGVVGYEDRWDDFTPAGREALAADLRMFRGRLTAVDGQEERWPRLAARVALEFVDAKLARHTQLEHLRDLNNIASPPQNLRDSFDIMDVDSLEGWQNVTARLHGLSQAINGYIEALEEGRRRGVTAARRQAEAVIAQTEVHSGDESSFDQLVAAATTSGLLSHSELSSMQEGADQSKQAYATLGAYLGSQYLRGAVSQDGVGRERYLNRAGEYLGIAIDPEEMYTWGWSEVERIRTEMEDLAAEIEPGAGRSEVAALLTESPARRSADRDEFIALMKERQHQAVRDLDGSHFDVPDVIRDVQVRIAPPGGALGAYYIAPNEDFTRPGSVWYSLGDEQQVPLFDHISTAYHEGFPGHHLQCGIQTALSGRLSRLHRTFVWQAGYGEGWALYVEQLMRDLGYLEKPDYVFGLLAAQMLRACRIAIDIGCHLGLPIPSAQPFHPGEAWTFETATEMLEDYATLSSDYAASEVTRYLGWPAQAISYKVGERVIAGLRDELQARQGEAFDLKDFHSRVLGSGPVGLGLLREIVLADQESAE